MFVFQKPCSLVHYEIYSSFSFFLFHAEIKKLYGFEKGDLFEMKYEGAHSCVVDNETHNLPMATFRMTRQATAAGVTRSPPPSPHHPSHQQAQVHPPRGDQSPHGLGGVVESPRGTPRGEQSRPTEVEPTPVNLVSGNRRPLAEAQDHCHTQKRRLDTDFVPSPFPAAVAATLQQSPEIDSSPRAPADSPVNPQNAAPSRPPIDIFPPQIGEVNAIFDKEGMNISERVRSVFERFFWKYRGATEADQLMEQIKRAERTGGAKGVQDLAEDIANAYEHHFNI